MIIIGERINSTRQKIQDAIKDRNASYILKQALLQSEAGAEYIDLNCAVTSGDELQDMGWVLGVLQSGMKDVSVCIDSPNYLAIERALSLYKSGGSVIINSITGDEARIGTILPLALKYKAKLIALVMDEKGMPESAGDRVEMAGNILENVRSKGFREEDLFFDPLIRPISTEPAQAREMLDSIPLIKKLGNVKVVCGLSNVSFGLPARCLVNSAFLAMAVQRGLDAAIMDPLDKNVLASAYAAQALMGTDDYCANYIKAFRQGKIN